MIHQNHPHANGNGVAVKMEPGLKEPVIKQEPGTGPAQNPMVYNAAAPRTGMAAQRAVQALQDAYGPRAAASIGAIQSGLASQLGNVGQQAPRPGQPQQPMNPQQYRHGVSASMQQRMQQQQQQQVHQQNGLPSAQLDGSNDGFEGVLMKRGPDGQPFEMGRVEIDNILHAQMLARAKEMEGGGLMLPLKEATKHRGVARKNDATSGSSQVDGPDDEVVDDDNLINSDLDDPDDEKDEDEDDEDSGHMMLCMYDKVQRVKNKW